MKIQEACVRAFGAVVSERPMVYLSCPITSGARVDEALGRGEDPECAIKENCMEAQRLARDLSLRAGSPVVCPAAFCGPEGWDWEDYMALWVPLLRTHIKTLALAPGWEGSRGCRAEYEVAKAHGLDVVCALTLSPVD